MQVLGTINIGQNIENAQNCEINSFHGSTKNKTKVEFQYQTQQIESKDKAIFTNARVNLAKKKGNKEDLFQGIMGLLQSGLFKSSNGSPATAEQVFFAFGEILGDDFSDYASIILADSKHDNGSSASTRVFETIQDSFVDYEKELIHNREIAGRQ